MTNKEYLELFEKTLEKKRNSFSRNLLLSYKNELTDPEWYQERMVSRATRRVSEPDLSEELAYYLFVYEALNIHAIDEKESPVPFIDLESVYRENVFVLQRLAIKNSIALLIEDVSLMSAAFAGAKQNAIVNVFKSTWNYTAKELGDINLECNRNSYLDFGYMKSAMTLRKTYGIQDLLAVGFLIFEAYKKKRIETYGLRNCYKEILTSCRIIFNLENPTLSTITLMGPNTLTLQGKTKIIEEQDFVDKIVFALKIFEICQAHLTIR